MLCSRELGLSSTVPASSTTGTDAASRLVSENRLFSEVQTFVYTQRRTLLL
jgi:hypothetical protein